MSCILFSRSKGPVSTNYHLTSSHDLSSSRHQVAGWTLPVSTLSPRCWVRAAVCPGLTWPSSRTFLQLATRSCSLWWQTKRLPSSLGTFSSTCTWIASPTKLSPINVRSSSATLPALKRGGRRPTLPFFACLRSIHCQKSVAIGLYTSLSQTSHLGGKRPSGKPSVTSLKQSATAEGGFCLPHVLPEFYSSRLNDHLQSNLSTSGRPE